MEESVLILVAARVHLISGLDLVVKKVGTEDITLTQCWNPSCLIMQLFALLARVWMEIVLLPEFVLAMQAGMGGDAEMVAILN